MKSNPHDDLEHSEKEASENLTSATIYGKVLDILSDISDIEPSTMNRDTRILQDLGLDSLEVYELVIDLEESYGIRLPDEELERLQTIGDIAEKIHEHLPGHGYKSDTDNERI